MNSKEYKLPNGKTAVFEYDDNGVGRITLEAMDTLIGMMRDDSDPEKEYLDLICEIQHNAIKDGSCHVGSSSDWCIFGKDIKAAIEALHIKRHSGNTFVQEATK